MKRGSLLAQIQEVEDPDYHPEPISDLHPSGMSDVTLEQYLEKFAKELNELEELHQKGTVKDFTSAKRDRKYKLEDKYHEFMAERNLGSDEREVRKRIKKKFRASTSRTNDYR